jgi:hypothetical protein
VEVFNNVTSIVKDDLCKTIVKGSKLSVAASCFSIYAYQELKKQLDGIESMRFVFTSPSFVAENSPKPAREFYIPGRMGEQFAQRTTSPGRMGEQSAQRTASPSLGLQAGLYGTEFEVKLRNELTQRAIARECAAWVRKKARFLSNATGERMGGFLNVESPSGVTTYLPLDGFTTVDLGCGRGDNAYNMTTRLEAPASAEFARLFDSVWRDKARLADVTEEVIDAIAAAYRENAPEALYFFTLHNVFREFLEDVAGGGLPDEATGFASSRIWSLLYSFQRDAALAIIGKLEKYNGCILADSVGLGKTLTALAVVKYYEGRNRNALVLCPKKLEDNWRTFRENYRNNPVSADRLRYDVLCHTDLSRKRGVSGGIDLERLNWGNYDLVVIDESHNFRNGGETYGADGRDNRYNVLMKRVARAGVKTKVLMLSATPVNNRFTDLRNQLALAYEGDPSLIDDKLGTKKPIDEVFRSAQAAFNRWSAQAPGLRTTASLLRSLDFDFSEVLDSVTFATNMAMDDRYRREKIARLDGEAARAEVEGYLASGMGLAGSYPEYRHASGGLEYRLVVDALEITEEPPSITLRGSVALAPMMTAAAAPGFEVALPVSARSRAARID